MQFTNYSFIYWQLKKDFIVGKTLEYNHTHVADNLDSLKFALKGYLQDQGSHSKTMTKVKMKVFNIKVIPTYKTTEGVYPVNEPVTLPVTAIYGESEDKTYICHIPVFNISFYYYRPHDLNTLAEHNVISRLKELTPESTYSLFLAPPITLDFVRIQTDAKKKSPPRKIRKNEYLSEIAEQYPLEGKSKKNIAVFPEVAWGMETLVSVAMELLYPEKNNVLLVGEHGVGKSVILQTTIKKIRALTKHDEQPPTFWKTDPKRLISKARYFGEWQGICEEIVVKLANENGYLWLINLMDLFSTGGEGAEDSMASYLGRFLVQGKLFIISELTTKEYEAARKIFPAFIASFHIIKIDEPSMDTVEMILDNYAKYIMQEYKVTVEKPVLKILYRLLNKYIKYELFPGKAVNYLTRILNNALMKRAITITKSDFIHTFIEITGIAEIFLNDKILLTDSDLQSFFKKRIKGQDQVLEQLYTVIKIFKTGLNDPDKPVATMLFAGPTGVGKTATTKALAEFIFGQGQKHFPLIRLDMSEYQHPAQIDRLIGSGYANQGILIQEIRKHPFSVILFDEIEKAHKSIFDALLTLLDEGILVDSLGRVADFRNAIVVMTSNLGAKRSITPGFIKDDSDNYSRSIKAFFRPEFINRIDHILVFRPIESAIVREIAVKELDELSQREGFVKRNILLHYSDALVDHIAIKGFDEKLGARPLQRQIEQLVVTPLAKFMLHNRHLENATLLLDYEAEIVSITSKPEGR